MGLALTSAQASLHKPGNPQEFGENIHGILTDLSGSLTGTNCTPNAANSAPKAPRLLNPSNDLEYGEPELNDEIAKRQRASKNIKRWTCLSVAR
ncbi:hypothetical protein GCM10022203_22530 [Micrococcus yunnanensis]|nr:hypothetical protein MICRO116_1050003 [Micrococcus sp. 116]